jgi:very-short-patch-repair endonuclease
MAGLRVETQVYIDGVGWVDFLIEGRIVVEIDGLEFHLSPKQFAKDRQRDNAAAGHGLRTLRFTYDDVIRRPEHMIVAIRAALGAVPR